MSNRWCGESIEESFGPTVSGCRGNFDFTVAFEQIILSIAPSVVFLTLLPFRFHKLYGAPTKARGGWLLPAKVVSGQENIYTSR
jgi:ATP-binding cassette subfamily C (CFTR/MRP) protein 1